MARLGASVVVADRDLFPAPRPWPTSWAAPTSRSPSGWTSPIEAQIDAAFAAAVLAFGGVDLVVNNAGLSLSKPLLDTSVDDWDLQHAVMARAVPRVARAAARVMIDQRAGGDIVYIASKNSVFAGPNNVAYSAAKADQAHQVRLLAVELGEHGIKVNGINPDAVVQGSGIFAGGWGAAPAATYGIDESELGAFYASAPCCGARSSPSTSPTPSG